MLTKQEIRMIQSLADNYKGTRDTALKKLSAYISEKSTPGCPAFDEEGLQSMWKGLFFCMYNADKPLVQETLTDSICELLKKFSTNEEKQLFFKAAMDTYAKEFDDLDKFRVDKYYDLFTVLVRQVLLFLRETNWNKFEVKKTVGIIEQSIFGLGNSNCDSPITVKCHMTDILMLEVAKIGNNEIKYLTIKSFLMPFLKVLVLSKDYSLVSHVKSTIIDWIIDQSGEKYESEDFFDSEGNLLKTQLDPRGGGQDVMIPQLNIKLRNISKTLKELVASNNVSAKKKFFIKSICKDLRSGIDHDLQFIEKHTDLINQHIIRQNLKKKQNRRKKKVYWK